MDDQNVNPADVVEAMLRKAIDNKSFKEMADTLTQVQENVDTVFNVWQQNASRTATAVTQLQMGMEVTRYAISSIIDVMIKHGLLTEEEWDEIQEKNAKQLEEAIEKSQQAHKEAIEEAARQTKTKTQEEEKEEEEESEEEDNSDVVLASEKAGEVLHFPGKKE